MVSSLLVDWDFVCIGVNSVQYQNEDRYTVYEVTWGF